MCFAVSCSCWLEVAGCRFPAEALQEVGTETGNSSVPPLEVLLEVQGSQAPRVCTLHSPLVRTLLLPLLYLACSCSGSRTVLVASKKNIYILAKQHQSKPIT